LLLRRWVVERSFAWATRFRRRARDYEWLVQTLGRLALLGVCLLDVAAVYPFDIKFITGSRLILHTFSCPMLSP
jgi:hypothetical protein